VSRRKIPVPRILAIDVGTTRLKAAIVDDSGTISRLLSRALPRTGSPTEQDAGVWLTGCTELLRELVRENGPDYDAIGLTGNMHAFLPVGSDGVPLMPAVLWNDTRATDAAAELSARAGSELLARTGNPMIPGFPLAKWLLFQRERPDVLRQTVALVQPKDLIGHLLTGQQATDVTDASGFGCLDLVTRKWLDDLLAEFALPSRLLPPVLASTDVRGLVTASAATRTGLKAGIPVVAGAGDLVTAALGGGVSDRTMAVVIGTAGQVLTVSPAMPDPLKGRIFGFCHAVPGLCLLLGTVPAGGFTLEWTARLLDRDIHELTPLADTARSEAIPTLLPYLQGTGTPHMRYETTATVSHLTPATGPAELARAATEAVLFAMRESVDVIRASLDQPQRTALHALAARDPLLRRLAGLLLAPPIVVGQESEASLVGAAALAGVGTGLYPSLTEAQNAMVRLGPLQPQPPQPGDDGLDERWDRYRSSAAAWLERRG
jgi:xylulokinase